MKNIKLATWYINLRENAARSMKLILSYHHHKTQGVLPHDQDHFDL